MTGSAFHPQRRPARNSPPRALAVVAATVLALVFVGGSSAVRQAANAARDGQWVRAGVPRLGRIIPERLPPFIVYYSQDPANPDGPVFGLFLMKPDGSDAHQVLPGYAFMPSWSPDGTRILFASFCSVSVMDADGGNQHQLIPRNAPDPGSTCANAIQQPRWSPSGRRILYLSGDQTPMIHIANADGSHDHPVAHTKGAYGASFSPDGRYIVFSRSEPLRAQPQRPHIYVIRPDGTDLRQITHGRPGEDPSWSPDGRRIIYACSFKHGANGHLVTYATTAICEISRAHPKQRTLYSYPDGIIESPTWSADGKEILVTYVDTNGQYGGEEQIALMAASGGSLVPVTQEPGTSSNPNW